MWFVWLAVALVIFVIIIALPAGYVHYKRHFWSWRNVPHERPPPLSEVITALFGIGVHLEWADLEFYEHLYRQFKGTGPFCGFYRLLQPRALILERELITQILIKDFSNFNDRGVYHNSRQDPLSADLFNRNGEKWKVMRLRLEPIFSKAQMRSLYPSVYAAGDPWMERFDALVKQHVEEGGYIEMRTQMQRYVLNVIALCVFDLNEQHQVKHPLDIFADMTHLALTTTRHNDFVNAILRRHPHLGQRFQISTTSKVVEEYFMGLITDVVEERERLMADGTSAIEDDGKSMNYMQLLIEVMTQELSTHESEEESMKDLREHLMEELAAHAFGFLKVGLKPTTNTLTYVLYELALNEEVQEQVRKEVQEAMKRNNNELNYECVQQLKYMGQVISETLRLHPIIPYLIRRTLNDYPVQNSRIYVLHKDMFVIIPTYCMHTDASYYPDPYLFKPERFASSENKRREQCLWLGFGDGPRSCMGLHFAQLQMRIILARLCMKYRFAVDRTRLMTKQQNVVTLRVEPLEGLPHEGREAEVVI